MCLFLFACIATHISISSFVTAAEIDAEGDRHSEHPDNKSSTPPFIHLPPAAAAALETSHFSSTAVKRALELICDESVSTEFVHRCYLVELLCAFCV